MNWYSGGQSPPPPPLPECAPVFKNNLPPFESVDTPGDAFWEAFPFNPLPSSPSTVINWAAFQAAIDSVSSAMTPSQHALADLVISDLSLGADTLIDPSRVPLETVPNNCMPARSAAACADQLATMVLKRHISGPFSSPPFPQFRANPLFIIERNGKLRLILNLSAPEDASFNDAIDSSKVPDISMASPRDIADQILEFGDETHLSKLDHCAAFKLVPVRSDLVKYQGLHFMGKFFVETQLVFGSKTSPAIYDRLHEVFLLVAWLRSGVNKRYLHRTLDDFVAVTPNKITNERIVKAYMDLAREIDLPLAPLDDPDKAFIVKQQGVILGVDLNAETASWRIPADKVHRHRRAFQSMSNKPVIDRLDAERMLGMTQQVTNMLPILKPLTFPLLEAVQRTHSGLQTPVTPALRDTARIWLRIYFDLLEWCPLSLPMDRAPLTGPAIGVFPIINDQGHHIGVFIQSQSPTRIFWSKALQDRVFLPSNLKLAFPHVFLLTLGLLCAITTHAATIRGTEFTCFTDSALLTMILRKGRDKRCWRTSNLIKAIFTTLIHLSALPSFIVADRPPLQEALTVDIPTPVLDWLQRMRRSPADAIAKTLVASGIIPPL